MNGRSEAPQIWFSYNGGAFKGADPFFFDTAAFPWVKELESQWTVIRDELYQLLNEHEQSLVPYVNREMTSKPNQWKTFGLMFWSLKSRENSAKMPRTWKLVETIPNVLAASFNLLEPGTTIKPHRGDTNAIIRCHLGLEIPAPAPECAFRVGTETRGWKEGEFFMFCDAHPHTAWNNSDKRRYVFVVDILRPEFAEQKTAICSRVLSAIYLETVYQRVALLREHFSGRRAKNVLLGLMQGYFRASVSLGTPIFNPL
jgi:aspartyl/asparaginyl beta-hydroxylase (cupin superfamily)